MYDPTRYETSQDCYLAIKYDKPGGINSGVDYNDIFYTKNLPTTAILGTYCYTDPIQRFYYLVVADARKMYVPNSGGKFFYNNINRQLANFGLGTVEERQKQITTLGVAPINIIGFSASSLLEAVKIWLLIGLTIVVSLMIVKDGFNILRRILGRSGN